MIPSPGNMFVNYYQLYWYKYTDGEMFYEYADISPCTLTGYPTDLMNELDYLKVNREYWWLNDSQIEFYSNYYGL